MNLSKAIAKQMSNRLCEEILLDDQVNIDKILNMNTPLFTLYDELSPLHVAAEHGTVLSFEKILKKYFNTSNSIEIYSNNEIITSMIDNYNQQKFELLLKYDTNKQLYLDILFYILSNRKRDDNQFLNIIEHIVKNSSFEEYSYDYIGKIIELVNPFKDLSLSKILIKYPIKDEFLNSVQNYFNHITTEDLVKNIKYLNISPVNYIKNIQQLYEESNTLNIWDDKQNNTNTTFIDIVVEAVKKTAPHELSEVLSYIQENICKNISPLKNSTKLKI